MPPGEYGWPIIGRFPPSNRPLDETITKMRKKYGDVFTWKIGARNIVVLCEFQTIKKVFNQTESQDRANFMSFDVFTNFMKLGIFNVNGSVWQMSRRFTIRHLREMGMGRSSIAGAQAIEAQHLVEEFQKHTDKPTPVPMSLSIAILNVIWKLVSDTRFDVADTAIQDFQSMVIDVFADSQGYVILFDMFPYLIPFTPKFVFNWMGISGYIDKCQKFQKYMRQVIEEHEKTFNPDSPRDFIDSFLLEMSHERNKGSDVFNYDNLQITIADLFTAGSETTAMTIRWILIYLAAHPDVQAKVQAEMDAVVPRDRLPGLQDKDKLSYTEATFNEVERCISLTPLGMAHSTNADMEINGYHVPKGTILIANLGGCHADPAYWEKPDQFYPEHFLDEEGKFKPKKEGYVPFSIGRRVCPGENLAKMGIYMFGSALLHSFTFSAPEGVTISTERDPTERLFNMPKPVELIIRRRT